MPERLTAGAILIALGLLAGSAWSQESPPSNSLVPARVELSPAARSATEAEWLTDEERKALRVFHGVWEETDLDSPDRRALAALMEWRLDDPAFGDPVVDPELRAEAHLRAGELEEAIAALDGADSIRASRIQAMALEMLGRYAEADEAIERPVERLLTSRLEDAGELTEGVRALMVRSRIRGQPAHDYQTMLNLLGQARNAYDRLHWPAMLAEAELLLDKDNTDEAVAALHEAIALNPRLSEAWHALGQIAAARFDFESARLSADILFALNPDHPLAHLLLAEIALIEGDPARGLELVDQVLAVHPLMRHAHEIRCAALALTYDEEALAAALAEYDTLSPNSARAHYQAGQALAFDRQYEHAAELLNEAVRRHPKWPAPRIELALLELQSGRDALALAAMREVRELDRFNRRVANSLHLLEELMMNFRQVETEHFIIRYDPRGADQVVADLMPAQLERIHGIVSSRFEHEPAQKTVIELMPDHQWFAVRISGMPQIHTIAACTGPVIAMEVPREGPPQKHFGTYYWPQVIQHEYAHTITLSQTRNRIPHWLTEAAAVSIEGTPRDLDRLLMLVDAWKNNRLFDLDAINWAFVRPQRPGDRSLAYAQGHWMVEFMNERFGSSALIRLIERYYEGEREEDAIPRALGLSREEFYEEFLAWAGEQVRAWGYAPSPTLDELEQQLSRTDAESLEKLAAARKARLDVMARAMRNRVGTPIREEGRRGSIAADQWPDVEQPKVAISDEQLMAWLDDYPEHPDLLMMAAMRSLARLGEPTVEITALLEKYVQVRPADPTPHKTLALFWQQSEAPARAIPHLEELDARTVYETVYATALAKLYRDQGDFARALEKAMKAVHTDPYDAPARELAAAIAVQAGELSTARMHVLALTLLEPDRPQHQRRLEALDRLLQDARGAPK